MPTPRTAVPLADILVDARFRHAAGFSVKDVLIHEPTVGNIGAQLLLPANRFRIAAVVYLPVGTGLAWIGDAGMQPPATGTPNVGVNGFACEAGTGWVIDDTTGPIYAFSAPGSGDQHLQVYEAVDADAQRRAVALGL